MLSELIIDRSRWQCGHPIVNSNRECCHGVGMTRLENVRGYMCCLGFYCKAAGIENLGTATTPAGLWGKDVEGLTIDGRETQFCGQAMVINDDDEITNVEREQRLIELFRKNGVALSFVGDYT